jgi:HK97 family phage major capsid protein
MSVVDKELLDELKTVWESQFKDVHAQMKDEIKLHGEASAETEQKLQKINDVLDEKVAALDVRMQKLAEERAGRAGEEPSEQRKAFMSWARKGQAPEPELKVLAVSDDSTGGYLAPDEFVGEIIKGIVLYSPIRSISRVRPTSNRASRFPKRTGTFAAQWVQEQGTRSETTGLQYGLEEVPNHELFALVDINNQDLEDSYFDLEAQLQMEAEEQFGVAEGTAFVKGTGVGQPEGILTHPNVATVNSGSGTLLTATGIFDLSAALKSGYVPNARWLLNRKTLYAIRKLQDTTNQFLWTPQFGAGMVGGPPALIDGMPYLEVPDMPDVASGTKPLAIGDFKRGYLISDRIVIETQRDPYTQNTLGNVRFVFRKRTGGQVVLSEAIKLQNIA